MMMISQPLKFDMCSPLDGVEVDPTTLRPSSQGPLAPMRLRRRQIGEPVAHFTEPVGGDAQLAGERPGFAPEVPTEQEEDARGSEQEDNPDEDPAHRWRLPEGGRDGQAWTRGVIIAASRSTRSRVRAKSSTSS